MKNTDMRALVRKGMEVTATLKVGQGVHMGMDGVNCFLELERGYKPDAQVYLVTKAVAVGDSHAVQHYYHHTADLAAMQQWLLDDQHTDGVVDSLSHLMQRARELADD